MSGASRLALALLAVLLPGAAGAHPLAPSLLELEVGEQRTQVTLKTPLQRPPEGPVEPILPPACTQLGPRQSSQEGTGAVVRFEIDCGRADLVGQRVGLARLSETDTTGLVRVTLEGVPLVRQVVNGARSTLVIPAQPSVVDTVRSYLELGVEHILFGFDHLLFVAGLLLLIRSRRALVTTITAFTLGHSLTLALAVFTEVRLPVRWIEVAIAASLVWLASEALASWRGDARGAWRRPGVVAVGFGLLHGLGFAAALRNLGLPHAEIPLALAAFNVGIETGQLAFVAAVLLGVAGVARIHAWPRLAPAAAAYLIGILGVYWMLERALPG